MDFGIIIFPIVFGLIIAQVINDMRHGVSHEEMERRARANNDLDRAMSEDASNDLINAKDSATGAPVETKD